MPVNEFTSTAELPVCREFKNSSGADLFHWRQNRIDAANWACGQFAWRVPDPTAPWFTVIVWAENLWWECVKCARAVVIIITQYLPELPTTSTIPPSIMKAAWTRSSPRPCRMICNTRIRVELPPVDRKAQRIREDIRDTNLSADSVYAVRDIPRLHCRRSLRQEPRLQSIAG